MYSSGVWKLWSWVLLLLSEKFSTWFHEFRIAMTNQKCSVHWAHSIFWSDWFQNWANQQKKRNFRIRTSELVKPYHEKLIQKISFWIFHYLFLEFKKSSNVTNCIPALSIDSIENRKQKVPICLIGNFSQPLGIHILVLGFRFTLQCTFWLENLGSITWSNSVSYCW